MAITGVLFYFHFVAFFFLANGWQQETILDTEGNVKFFWTVDVKKNVLLFEVQVRTTGYVGLGISPNGTMHNADIMVGYVDNKGEPYLSDYWAKTNGQLEQEESHDWKLLTGMENSSHTMFRVRRPLQPTDHFDLGIYVEPSWVIWAYHPRDPAPRSLPHYHELNRGAKQICFIEPDCFPNLINGTPSFLSERKISFPKGRLLFLLWFHSWLLTCIYL